MERESSCGSKIWLLLGPFPLPPSTLAAPAVAVSSSSPFDAGIKNLMLRPRTAATAVSRVHPHATSRLVFGAALYGRRLVVFYGLIKMKCFAEIPDAEDPLLFICLLGRITLFPCF